MGHSRNDRRWTPLVNTRIALCYTAALLLLCIISWGSSSTGRAVSAADLESMDFASTAIPTKPKITVIPTKPKLRPIVNFVIPRPVYIQKPSGIPPAFIDNNGRYIDEYYPIRATLINVPQLPTPITDFDQAKLAVVRIQGCAEDHGCRFTGSGVIINKHGLILTAHHVLRVSPGKGKLNSRLYDDFNRLVPL